MMKKTLILACVMVLALGVAANAYVFNATVVDTAAGSGGNVQFADMNPKTGSWTAAQEPYLAVATFVNSSPLVTYWTNVAVPDKWTISVWAKGNWTGSNAVLKFWVQNLGNGGTLGSVITGKTWGIWDQNNNLLKSFTIGGTSSEASPTAIVQIGAVPVVSDPATEALTFTFGEVPEPGSMLAMLSGLVGLVGFGIRRRK